MPDAESGGPPERPRPRRMAQSEFGQRVIRWGTGDEAARARIGAVSRADLEGAGVTLEMAQSWLRFYERVVADDPRRRNPSARGRVDLMRNIVELLREGRYRGSEPSS